jgi:phage-related protein
MWSISYYNHRVKTEIEAWPVGIYANFLRLAQWLETDGLELAMPHSKSLSGGLFELRCRGAEGIGRAFYCTRVGHELIILHSFVKKSQATPEKELTLARRRLKEIKP